MNEQPKETGVEQAQARDFTEASDPFALFADWMREAAANEREDPDAMTLATVDASGLPNARMVLLKGFGPEGFVFYTNSESAKGIELEANPRAALLLYWKRPCRQVRIRGTVEAVGESEADAYFATRQRESRIGAWASQQSRPLPSRAALEEAVAHYEQSFAGKDVPRPDYWKSFRVVPLEIEFWERRPHRLHDRIQFRRSSPPGAWTKLRLYP